MSELGPLRRKHIGDIAAVAADWFVEERPSPRAPAAMAAGCRRNIANSWVEMLPITSGAIHEATRALNKIILGRGSGRCCASVMGPKKSFGHFQLTYA